MDKTEEEILAEELALLMTDADTERDDEGDESEEDELDLDNKEKESEDEDDDKEDSDDNNDEDEDNSDESDEDDNDDSDDDEDDKESEDDFEPIEVEVSGTKVTINSKEEMIKLATKGLDAVNITPNSDSEVDRIVEQGKLSKEDLTLLIDARNGDANAISKLAELGKIDVLDIDEKKAAEYTPAFELEKRNEVNEVAGQILADSEHATEFMKVKDTVPQNFVAEISADASKLRAFSGHIKSGLAQEIIPKAMLEVATNGGDFYSAYAKVGAELSKTFGKKEVKVDKKEKRVISEKEEKMRKRANSDDKNSEKKEDTSVTDIWNMPDDEFEAMVAGN